MNQEKRDRIKRAVEELKNAINDFEESEEMVVRYIDIQRSDTFDGKTLVAAIVLNVESKDNYLFRNYHSKMI